MQVRISIQLIKHVKQFRLNKSRHKLQISKDNLGSFILIGKTAGTQSEHLATVEALTAFIAVQL